MAKRILITGTTSYIGNQLTDWLQRNPEEYIVTKKSVRDNKWKVIDFSLFDVVVHVAGIAHQDTKADQEKLYYEINTDLTINIAKVAKEQGVEQFIFLSSIIVYGASGEIGVENVITKERIPEPINFYGNSKLLAEEGIEPLQSDDFNIAIIRPPMIYGKKSKGNYSLLSKFAKISPLFPDINNQRSMLYIDNMSELIRLLIKNEEKGLFFPQNNDYVTTSKMVKKIAEVNNKDLKLTKVFNPIINKLSNKLPAINKIFGNLVYDKKMSMYKEQYQVIDFEKSIKITEE